jgi:hypothetical protein
MGAKAVDDLLGTVAADGPHGVAGAAVMLGVEPVDRQNAGVPPGRPLTSVPGTRRP